MSYESFMKYEKGCKEDGYLEIKEFSSLKSCKLSWYSDISSKHRWTLSNEVFWTIKHLFDVSLKQGVFSEKPKITCVLLSSIFTNSDTHLFTNYSFAITAWKVFKYGVFLSRIFPYSVRMQENTDQKKLRIWTIFTQWMLLRIIKIH